MKKTNLFIVFLCCLGFLVSARSFSAVSAASTPKPAASVPFVVGTSGTVYDLDPADAWDSASNDVLDQVVEPLLGYNLSNPNGPKLAKLATEYRQVSDTVYEFTLRQGVKFQDGTDFNATAAKWNFDRWVNLTIHEETQLGFGFWAFPVDQFKYAGVQGLDWCSNGTNIMVWNRTEVIDNYRIRVTLNFPFGPFLDMLTYTGMSMVSPTAHAANFNTIWGVDTTKVVGTGPFKFVSYSQVDGEAKFVRFDDYWRGPAQITDLTYVYIVDTDTRNQALLSGDVDFLPDPDDDYMDQFQADADIQTNIGPQTLTIQYLGMEVPNIPKPVRQAMTYALNYSYIIDELLGGYAIRLTGFIPKGMQYYDTETTYPTFNVTKARQILIDGGIAPAEASGWTDQQWVDRATSNPLGTYNYTYNIGNQMREQLLQLLQDNFKHIGIKVTGAGMTWSEFLTRAFGGPQQHQQLELYFLGWAPDFNNPVTYTIPLWDPASSSASHGLNDPQITQWIYQALMSSNQNEIQDLYNKINDKLVNDQAPWCFCYQGINLDAWNAKWDGAEGNSMAKLNIYPIHEDNSGWTPGSSESPIVDLGPTTIPAFPLVVVFTFTSLAVVAVVLSLRKRTLRV